MVTQIVGFQALDVLVFFHTHARPFLVNDVGEHGEAVLHAEEGARRVNAPYIIDAVATPQGPRPAHIKDRVRALGPTVRPDLTLKPADPAAGDWII